MREIAALHAPDVIGLRKTSLGGHSDATVHDQCCGGHGLLQEAAAIPAQIDHQPRGMVVADALVEDAAHLFGGVAGEHGDFHDEKAADTGAGNGVRCDERSGQREVACTAVRRAYSQRHLSADVARQTCGRFVRRVSTDADAVDGEQSCAFGKVGFRCRSVGRHSAEHQTGAARDDDRADAAAAFAAIPFGVGRLGRHVAGVGIKMIEQFVEKALDDSLLARAANDSR